ncbi:RNA methyltransferase [Caldimonas thermodepolymerans]|jgi:TrmH family RNA methyltransferase|uniref:TrmH family RNA methyltransferase n=1 Tax=Caldimonas thermodepolymerans TaxID=215580 RepID=A0A2S5T1S6_9BURK|nr:RNA methyltransferase [Caldimonas thermodepolymerans]PPE68923.1 rRNA methyltransferase [Caldimonas thermodepolymerans]QPC30103.1 RNA methyltransferase [Caldimonas thermodepolymerans]RDI00479.1 TrmH family RNA methyltransferase [Caldimonas thermodepolymerans]TCP07242.1 TrmH family RNA methyltransferase [Caldimonas thermodepolymerans]UZG42856.1 RNA methyltransferase [Caldimonas thermodepolymerans]
MGVAVQRVTSRDNPLLVRLRKLARDGAAYRKLGEVWLEGEHLCSAYLARGGEVAQAVVSESAWEREPVRALCQAARRITLIPDALFHGVSALESPSGHGFVVPWQPPAAVQPGVASVVLDRLQDAGNVGSVLRSAAALGVPQVVALRGTVALWSQKVLRAGMGAHFGLSLVEAVDPAGLDALGVPLVGTSSHTQDELPSTRLPWPCAWVLGNEGQGVDPQLQARCALTVRIPQPGGEESLNVAAAAAVCFYESLRQRLGQ